MDVEEYVRRKIAGGCDEPSIEHDLADQILGFKEVRPEYAAEFARAVIDEVKNSKDLKGDFFTFGAAGVKMGVSIKIKPC